MLIMTMITYNLSTGCDFDPRVQWAAVIYLTTQCLLFMNFYSKSYGKKNGRKNAVMKKTDSHSETPNVNNIETNLYTDSSLFLRKSIDSNKDSFVIQNRAISKLG